MLTVSRKQDANHANFSVHPTIHLHLLAYWQYNMTAGGCFSGKYAWLNMRVVVENSLITELAYKLMWLNV